MMLMPTSIRLELAPSGALLALGAAALLAAAGSVLTWHASGATTVVVLALLGAVGTRALMDLCFGRHRALQSLEWRGGDRWLLRRADGRCADARLHPASRRIGVVVLLMFRRGVFRRRDRPWLLLLPHMVSDHDAARRLRVRLTLDGPHMRGLMPS